MQLLIIIASSLLLAHSALGSPYQFVRQCKSSTEPCMSLQCEKQPSGKFPQSTTYGCCLGKIIDARKHVCAVTSGVTRAEACNPCTEFNCGNGECTLASWKCNGEKNCQDGSDEMGCGSCGKHNFRCSNGRCIPKQQVCDKVSHCGDGSDEMHCLTPSGIPCDTGSFRCANNKCTDKRSVVCNGVNDCGDFSDERGCHSGAGKKRSIRYQSKDDFEQDNNEAEGKLKPKDAETPTILML